jgi:serine/threonine protein kinase
MINDNVLNIPVALKRIKQQYLLNGLSINTIREIAILKELDSEYLVKVYSYIITSYSYLIFDNYLVIRCYNYPIKYLFNI